MLALYKKEVSTFLGNPVGYIVIGVFLALTSLFLWVFKGDYNVLSAGYANIDGLFLMAPWLYLFLVPAITMRLLADERRTGTLELLLSYPISRLHIVMGKFLAGLTLVLISLLPTLVYAASVYIMGDPVGNMDMGGLWGSYIGLLFLAGVYVAIGVFASSLTDNQITAFITAAVLCAFFFYGFDLIGGLSSSGSTQALVSGLGICAHYDAMSRGVIDSRDVVYLLLLMASFLGLTVAVLNKKQ